MSPQKPTLLAAIQAQDPFIRAHISAIHIRPAKDGYHATISIHHYGAIPLAEKDRIEEQFPGVTVGGFQRHSDVETTLDWHMPIWDQIVQLVHDTAMSTPDNLGCMRAIEMSRDEADGTVTKREALQVWTVSTHVGSDRERQKWLARCMQYSATTGSPSE